MAVFILRAAAALAIHLFIWARRTACSFWSSVGEMMKRSAWTGRVPSSDEDLDVLADDDVAPAPLPAPEPLPLPAPVVAPVAPPADVSVVAGRAQTPEDGAGLALMVGGVAVEARGGEEGEDKENGGGLAMHGLPAGKRVLGGTAIWEHGQSPRTPLSPLSPCGAHSPALNAPVDGAGGQENARVDVREGASKLVGGAGAALPLPLT